MIAAIYARKSTEQNGVSEEAKSVARQVQHARLYAEKKGWTVGDEHIYIDDGISGAEFANRLGFLRLMNALKPKPLFQVLIMSEESRLGREMVDTMGALKQIVVAGVRVFYYVTDTERTLDSPIEKAMMALETFGAELEREKARQRTHDALLRKARAGQVTGGACFGYDNVNVMSGQVDKSGRPIRSHVTRRINGAEAAVVGRIFALCAEGYGLPTIAKSLNGQGALSPRAQQGRPKGWAPSSVREILYRSIYRGEIVWNQSRKRDSWGQRKQQARPECDWLRIPAPDLRIIADGVWNAAHERLARARQVYLRGTNGRLWGHPVSGTESKYLLPGLCRCGVCNGGVFVHSRSHGQRRANFYACTSYHKRGRAICWNGFEISMERADRSILTAIEQHVLRPDVVQAALSRAADSLKPRADAREAERRALAEELAAVDAELDKLVTALTTGGELPSLLTAMQAREGRRKDLTERLAGLDAQRSFTNLDLRRVRRDLERRLDDWQRIFAGAAKQSALPRQALRKLLSGPIILTPKTNGDRSYYEFTGRVSLGKLLVGVIDPTMVASLMPASWNQIAAWLDQIDRLRRAA